MFSSLNQGSPIYILDKSDRPTLMIGQIQSISAPHQQFTGYSQFNNATIDMKVSVEGNTFEYNAIPGSNTIVSYNNGKITLSETKQGLQQEVENLLQTSTAIVNNIDKYKQNITDCETILKQLNPQFAKDKERDERLNNLEERFGGVETKIDKLLTLIDK